MKHTAMRNAIAALMEQLAPRGSHVLIRGGLPDGASPPEGPATAPGEPVGAPPPQGSKGDLVVWDNFVTGLLRTSRPTTFCLG